MTESSTARIRELNDVFRKTFAGGKMVMSASVAALPEMVRASALIKVAEFTDFTLEDGPAVLDCRYHHQKHSRADLVSAVHGSVLSKIPFCSRTCFPSRENGICLQLGTSFPHERSTLRRDVVLGHPRRVRRWV